MKQTMAEILEAQPNQTINRKKLSRIEMDIICRNIGYSIDTIFEKRRDQDLIAARYVFFYILNKYGYTLPELISLSLFDRITIRRAIMEVANKITIGDALIMAKYNALIQNNRNDIIFTSHSIFGFNDFNLE